MNPSSAHIVAIRRDGAILGHQLRVGGGGVGQTKYFSVGRFGSPEKARRAAEREARELGLPKARERGGSDEGRVPSSSATGTAGIRFEWTPGVSAPILRVVATWTDRRGVHRQTSYSCQRNGLQGALDKAIKARISCGAPLPDRAALLRRLRREHATRGETN